MGDHDERVVIADHTATSLTDRFRQMREEIEINRAHSAFEHMKKHETKRRDHKHRGAERESRDERALELAPTVMVFAPGLHVY